ncbi:zinc finger protein 883 [Drosophila kikkawai]|uniref:Zinc finger protein 883 n=1 Tax=Drosophila kikkawai TaxID=30033 RepID=A0A6P4I515_DROKI|nr:zinc finger protein 883 [Drosophila kikkawai]
MERLDGTSMEKSCRVCAGHSTILVDPFSSEISDPPISEMLNSILAENCRVDRDALPQKICPTCLVAAQQAFHFKHKCERSYRYFSNLVTAATCDAVILSKRRGRSAAKEPVIAFEMVGCEDPLDTTELPKSEGEEDGVVVKDDIDSEPAESLSNERKIIPEVQVALELAVNDDIKIEKDQMSNGASIDGVDDHDKEEDAEDCDKDDDEDEVDGDEWSDGWSEDQDEPKTPRNSKTKSRAVEKDLSLLCTECGLTCKSHKLLTRHIARHKENEDPQRPHLCDTCGRGFRTRAQLTIHTRMHTGERPFKCTICPKAYTHGPTLRMHMLTHETKAHKCLDCEKSFYSISNLRAHQRWHSGDRPYQCPDCPQTFTKNSGLKLHQRLHTGERPYKCHLCDQGFVQNHHLVTHLRVHNEDRQFKCPDCDKSFFEKSNMKKHQRTHSGVKPFQCEECGRGFSHNHHLKNHLRVHTGEKPYKCERCDKRFCANQSLAKHILWHAENQDRAYNCSKCHKGFDKLQALRAHEKKHRRQDEPNQLYQCPHCDVKFALKKTLDKHIGTHKIRPYPCSQCLEGFFSQKSYQKHLRLHNLQK